MWICHTHTKVRPAGLPYVQTETAQPPLLLSQESTKCTTEQLLCGGKSELVLCSPLISMASPKCTGHTSQQGELLEENPMMRGNLSFQP